MAHLSLGVLGSLQVLIDDKPVAALESDKVCALLVYLAVEADRAHRRESLVGLLWPDSPEQVARHNLRQALFNLRLAIGDHTASPPYLLISREAIQFSSASDFTLDLAQFNTILHACEESRRRGVEDPALRAARLEELVKLYRGEFLQGFFLADSAEFEQWALVQRERWHQQALDALSHLADYYERHGDFQAARRHALRQLELDPWREEAYCQLMRRAVLEDYSRELAARSTPRDRQLLIVQAIVAVLLVLALAFHVAEVGLIGLLVIILATAFTGITEEHRIGKAFEAALPFTALLVVFFVIVAEIHDQHLFEPMINHVLALEGSLQAVMLYLAAGVLSSISDNVFVASVYITEIKAALLQGTITREQFDWLAVAINTGTNIPSVATPNGQAAFLFLLTSTLAPLIRLGYGRMVWMALPYFVVMTRWGWGPWRTSAFDRGLILRRLLVASLAP